jgi:phage replication O-like protein O
MCASPQLEDGYTKVAHEIIEALASTKLTTLEAQAVFLIVRNTYGWNRKIWQVKQWKVFSDIGIHKSLIKETLFKLAERKIITLDWDNREIAFQKDYDLWQEFTTRELIRDQISTQKVSQVTNSKVSQVTNSVSQVTNSKVSQVTNSELVRRQTQVSQATNSESCEPLSPLTLPAPKDTLNIDLKKQEEIYKESSSSSKDIVVQEEDEDELKNKKAKKILSKQFGDISCFLYEDLVKIGGFEEEQIKTVAENARRQKVHFRNLSTWIMRGLDEYEEKYKKKEEKPISTSEVTAVRVAKNPPMNYATAYQELSSVKNFIDIDSFIENGFIPDRQYGNIIVICRDMFKHLEMFPGLESEYEKAYPGRLDVMRDMLEYISDREKEAEVSND